ncbi:phosphoglucomutase A [Heterostelium album PN500]|uniref:phosphoglucomutase (alpha-D-glucose-1,6-bisphosphate-dependent) n=1 Tax=Heterostelium pallidum (strain ATCC 26659 / Pp 5 / PN500) TaxID=670386 RepID=D3BII3_HETP5|nr:phosphoglucomutase A [Heterostelium album PN500]EFA78607.1 phosphoglucomutase A [Heterostelium album PN500]|eukprot:XP_020430731.1 phosphoglucomutase A [Heterostelium album PN500]
MIEPELITKTLETKPFSGQKPGTSGLRKKVTEFQNGLYLHNFVQSIFNVLDANELKGATLVVGGDGRFYNKQAIQVIFGIAAANGIGKVLVGQNGLLSTPAISAVVRARRALGAIILTASHNPGGPNGDFGIKYNIANGGPAPESITNAIYQQTTKISEIRIAENVVGAIDLSKLGVTQFKSFTVEVIDSVSEYATLLKSIFDFNQIKSLVARKDFVFNFDAMSGVTGVYASRIFSDLLGVPLANLINCVPSEDFNGGHPDPNLTYAPELVDKMNKGLFDCGCASDGDGDRNMVLGKRFFVNPSDSVAVIASNYQSIPYFKSGLKGLARSMPTSAALDLVAKDLKIPFFEVPTGWKFFGNLMDANTLSICGEESFGTGSDHIREKDGIWAICAWLQILAVHNADAAKPFVSIESIVHQHWRKYGRNYYSRYDYEEVDTKLGDEVMKVVSDGITDRSLIGRSFNKDGQTYVIEHADNFEYKDPIDKSVSSNQGLRIIFSDGSRIIYRLSGTGSTGATIRVYFDKYEREESKLFNDTQTHLKFLISIALELSKLTEITKRTEPNVIT